MGSDPTGGMDVYCECCVLSGRGLCDELITRPEESVLSYLFLDEAWSFWGLPHCVSSSEYLVSV